MNHWLPDYCKPYIKDTEEVYAILEKKGAFICTQEKDGGCDCFSCSGGDTWEERLLWIARHFPKGWSWELLTFEGREAIDDVIQKHVPTTCKDWALMNSNMLKQGYDAYLWYECGHGPKLSSFEEARRYPPPTLLPTIPTEASSWWIKIVELPQDEEREIDARLKLLVEAKLLPKDFTEEDLRAFVEKMENNPCGYPRAQWKAKAPDPAIQQQGSRASKPRKKKQGPGRGRKRGLYLRRAIVALCMNSGHGPTNTFEMLKDFSEQQEELSALENEEWPEELHTRSLKLHTIKADYKLIREDPSCANTENLKGKEKDIYSLFTKELG